ncbi:MAG: hypothetical protein ACR2FN_06670 [Chitinophagaceae bacterium]
MKLNSGTVQTQINVQSFSKGWYYLRIVNDKKEISIFKFLKE